MAAGDSTATGGWDATGAWVAAASAGGTGAGDGCERGWLVINTIPPITRILITTQTITGHGER